MKRKIAGILFGISMSAALLAGCGEKSATEVANESAMTESAGNGEIEETEGSDTEQTEEEPMIQVGVLLSDVSEEDDGTLLTEDLLQENYQAVVLYADEDKDKQLTQFEELLSQEIHTFVIDPVNAYSFTEAIASAKENTEEKITILAYKDLIMDTNQLNYYVTFDYREAGWQTAEQIIKDLNLEKRAEDEGPLYIEFLMGAMDDMGALFYYNGMLEKLAPYLESGKLNCRSGRTSFQQTSTLEKTDEDARKKLEEIMESYEDNCVPDVIVAGYEQAAHTAAGFITEKGIVPAEEKWPYIVGYACGEETVIAIADGRIRFSICMDERKLAEKCTKLIDTCLKGKDPEIDNYELYDNGIKIIETNLSVGQIIDQKNYNQLMKNEYFSEETAARLEEKLKETAASLKESTEEGSDEETTAKPEAEDRAEINELAENTEMVSTTETAAETR